MYSNFRTDTPGQDSGRSTPASNKSGPGSQSTTTFANLVSFNSNKAASNLSLQERQKQLEQERLNKNTSISSPPNQFGGADSAFWDSLEKKGTPNGGSPAPLDLFSSTASKPATPASAARVHQASKADDDFDLLGDFSSQPLTRPAPNTSTNGSAQDRDDDPFGLGTRKSQPPPPNAGTFEDEDVLGLLGKPVSEVRRAVSPQKARSPSPEEQKPQVNDRRLAELVDMGFPPERAQVALAETGTVQAAVSWLLNQAHNEAKQKAKGRYGADGERFGQDSGRGQDFEDSPQTRGTPTWMQAGKQGRETSNNGDMDVGKLASEIGNNLFKSANSLWNTSRKKVQKAVSEFQQDGSDPNVPKWMREAQAEQRQPPSTNRDRSRTPQAPIKEEQSSNITDEALMLEGGSGPPSRKQTPSAQPSRRSKPEAPREQSPAFPESITSPRPLPERTSSPATGLSLGLNRRLAREAIEEQSGQAYISPARRRTPASGASTPVSRDEKSSPVPSQAAKIRDAPQRRPQNVDPPRPKPKPRHIPQVSPNNLQNYSAHKARGAKVFKEGDYGASLTSYSSALTSLPSAHPLTIPLLTNRSLVHLKLGAPREAMSDAERALTLIGPSRGEGERIAFGGAEGDKEMREFWSKAVMRKAEALEQLEKWSDALAVWRLAVEGGVGGAVSIAGRNRCEKALNPQPKPAATAQRSKPIPRRPQPSVKVSAEAVTRLRAANAAAEKLDDEKFALNDAVSLKIDTWKKGKESNLRALLASLDTVLWADSGWKKVGLHELVLAPKVKIAYMKGIAKVHPDKIPTNASTEQRMLSASVFAALNEAWDRFKTENGL